MNKNKILITGASGFIGTNVLQYFLDKGFTVVNIDKVPPKNKNHIKYWREVDILNAEKFEQIVIDFSPDYILHLAARTDLNGRTLNEYSDNIQGVVNLMKIVSRLPDLKKVVVTSSMLVCHGGYYPKNQFDYSPTTLYGESKVETEKIVWAKKPSCDWAILRPTSIWGPWFGIPYKNFFDLVISKKYFHIGNKSCTKTYGYVGNAVYQIDKVLLSNTKDESKKVFFIGDNPPTDIEEWGNEIAQELGYKIIKMPYILIKLAAVFGDFLKIVGVNFPMNSFRLHNMTTDNLVNLENTYEVAPELPYTRIEGVRRTLQWIIENK